MDEERVSNRLDQWGLIAAQHGWTSVAITDGPEGPYVHGTADLGGQAIAFVAKADAEHSVVSAWRAIARDLLEKTRKSAS